MSAAGSREDLRRVAQAIALGEGFQLLVLECHGLPPGQLVRLFDEVQGLASEASGVPPLVLIYDPRLAMDWIADVLVPILGLPRPTAPGASIVAVIDGTDATFGGVRREKQVRSNWQFLFQQLNERRNSIARALAGTLIVALTPELVGLFLQEAPDMASLRGGVFRVDDSVLRRGAEAVVMPMALKAWYSPILLRELAYRRVAANPELREVDRHRAIVEFQGRSVQGSTPRGGAPHQLVALLLSLFSTDELRRFVHYAFPEVSSTVPGAMASPAAFASAVVEELGRQGRIDNGLFDRIGLERPAHREEIDRVAGRWGYSPHRGVAEQGALVMPSDLYDLVLQLSASEREQIMYLAGFAGDAVSTQTMRGLRERPPISAREILERARAGGPGGLTRLAEAIGIVTASR